MITSSETFPKPIIKTNHILHICFFQPPRSYYYLKLYYMSTHLLPIFLFDYKTTGAIILISIVYQVPSRVPGTQ